MRTPLVSLLVISATAMFLTVCASPAAQAAEGNKLVELAIELPEPQFEGTPTDAKSDILDPNTGNRRKPFLAPEGLTNVAAGKPVTGSDDDPIIGDLDMLTDGDKDGADGSFTEFMPGLQWVQVDFGAEYEIFAVVLWHFHKEARIYHDIVVQLSNDPEFQEGVITVYNNDQDNSAGLGAGKDWEWIETNEGRLMDARGAKGRYLRCYSDGNTTNDMNQYIEVEAYGRPAKP